MQFHLICLTKSMSSGHCLQVSMRIPITAPDIFNETNTITIDNQQKKYNTAKDEIVFSLFNGEGKGKNRKTKSRNTSIYLSYIMTVSAVARFIPKPPALVDSKKQNLEEFLALNRSIRICLSAPPTFPSIL